MITSSSLGIAVEGNLLRMALAHRGLLSVTPGHSRVVELPEEPHDLEDFITLQVRDFLAAEQARPNMVILSIPREEVMMRLLELPDAVLSNLDEAISYEAEKHIPIPEAASLGTHWAVGKPEEKKIRVWLVRMKRDQIAPLLDALRVAGGVDAAEISPISLWRHVPAEDRLPRTLVFDVRGGMVELDLFQDGELVYSRAAKAPVSPPPLSFLEQMAAEALQGLKGEWLAQSPRSAVLFGAGHLAPQSRPALFGCDKVHFLEDDRGIAEGAAMRDVDAEPLPEKNLLSGDLRARRREYGRVIAMALLVLAVALFLGGFALRTQAKAQALSDLQRTIADVKPKHERATALDQRLATDRKTIEEFRNLESQYQVKAIDVLFELTDLFPSAVMFERFDLKNKDITIAGYEPPELDIIPDLERSPLFHVTNPGSSQPRGGDKRFDNIELRIEK